MQYTFVCMYVYTRVCILLDVAVTNHHRHETVIVCWLLCVYLCVYTCRHIHAPYTVFSICWILLCAHTSQLKDIHTKYSTHEASSPSCTCADVLNHHSLTIFFPHRLLTHGHELMRMRQRVRAREQERPRVVRNLLCTHIYTHTHTHTHTHSGGSLASVLAKFGALEECVVRKYTSQILAGRESPINLAYTYPSAYCS